MWGFTLKLAVSWIVFNVCCGHRCQKLQAPLLSLISSPLLSSGSLKNVPWMQSESSSSVGGIRCCPRAYPHNLIPSRSCVPGLWPLHAFLHRDSSAQIPSPGATSISLKPQPEFTVFFYLRGDRKAGRDSCFSLISFCSFPESFSL